MGVGLAGAAEVESMGATGSASKSSNDSGANDSSIDADSIDADADLVAVASAGEDSVVVGAVGTRATKEAIAPVLSVLEVDVDASGVVALDVGSEALEGAVATDGAIPVGASAEVDQPPDVDADVLDGAAAEAGAAAGPVKAEPVAFDGGVGLGGGFGAGGGDAAGAGRAGGTVGIADREVGLLTVVTRDAAVEPAAEGVTGRLALGEPGAAPEGSCVAGEAACPVDGAG